MLKSTYHLAKILSYLTLIAAITLPVIAAAIWLFWDYLAPLATDNLHNNYNLKTLENGARFAGFGLFLIGAFIQSYGLLGLRRTFKEASVGRSLSAISVDGFKRYAWVTLVMVFFNIIQRTGLIALFSYSDPAHKGALSIQFGSNELGALFFGLLLVFVGHVFVEGKHATDEKEAFL